MTIRPPKLAERLILLFLRSQLTRAGVLGDLHEEFTSRLRRRSPLGCRIWYWGQALMVASRFAVEWIRVEKEPALANEHGVASRSLFGRANSGFLSGLAQDLKFGFRALARSPLFGLTIILTQALAIGVNSAVFSVINATLIHALPFPDPQRIVMVANERDGAPESLAPADYVDWSATPRLFEGIAAYQQASFNLSGEGRPEQVSGLRVTAEIFPVLGVSPLLGRDFDAVQEGHGERVAVIGYGLWQRKFAADSEIVGREIVIDNVAHVVVGVMPPEFRFPNQDPQIWLPLALSPAQKAKRSSFYLNAVARLQEGVTLSAARSVMAEIAARSALEFPQARGELSIRVTPLQESLAGGLNRGLLLAQAAAILVLLIACANIANLILARSALRQGELATRAALGAGRHRISRQLLTESLLLSFLGGALGLLLTRISLVSLVAWMPADLSWAAAVSIDPVVLGFTLTLSLVTGIVFGLLPAFRAGKADLAQSLKLGPLSGRGGSGGRVSAGLVVVEVALAVVLLVAAGLLTRSFSYVTSLETGFRDPDLLLTMRIDLSPTTFPTAVSRTPFYQEIVRQVQSLPGVRSAGLTAALPYTISGGSLGVTLEGRDHSQSDGIFAVYRGVTADYLQTMAIPLVSGRYFRPADFDSRAAMIINRSMAERYWPEVDPVGRRMKMFGPDSSMPWATIVGVVEDVRQFELQTEPSPQMYAPSSQVPILFFTPRDLVIRCEVDPGGLVASVREEIWSVAPTQAISNVRTMGEILSTSLTVPRFQMRLFAALGGLALVLALVGSYAVISFWVNCRSREIGIRLTLGASRSGVVILVVRRALTFVLLGAAAGLAVAISLSGGIRSWLYGIDATDPLTYMAIAALLIASGTAASLIPAFRATRVDPLESLRTL